MMQRIPLLSALALALVLVAVGIVRSDSTAGATTTGDIVPGQFIVIVNAGYDPGQVAAEHAAVPAQVYKKAARGFAAKLSNHQIVDLAADPRVKNIIPDRYVHALGKPTGKPGGSGGTTAQVIPAGVKRVGADQVWGSLTGSGIGVAVIDTGIDFNHGDLSVAAPCFTAFAFCQDDNGHGTHVAGIIAARNNTQDVVGVAPGATLYAVKVLDQSGSGTWSQVMAGVDWVTAHADVISVANMSLGGSGSNTDGTGKTQCGVEIGDSWNSNGISGEVIDPLHKAICGSVAAGVIYIVAAGNDPNQQVTQMVPAAYPQVIAAASATAVDGSNACNRFSGKIYRDTASYFTTDGAGVSISAPGEEREDISRGCLIKSLGILSTKLGGGTTRMSGTSMAAPHVAGVATLTLQRYPSLSPTDVRSRIESSADRMGTAPLDSPTTSYTFDGEREGIAWAPGATQ